MSCKNSIILDGVIKDINMYFKNSISTLGVTECSEGLDTF